MYSSILVINNLKKEYGKLTTTKPNKKFLIKLIIFPSLSQIIGASSDSVLESYYKCQKRIVLLFISKMFTRRT